MSWTGTYRLLNITIQHKLRLSTIPIRLISTERLQLNQLLNDTSLTQDQNAFRESMHQMFEKKLTTEICHEIDKKDEFEDFRKYWTDIGSFGLHGITVPTKDGGLGLGYLDHCLAVEAMSEYSAAVALSYGAHSNLCLNQISLNGNEEQKEKYLPKLIDGSHVGSLAMSETSAGSDVTAMKTSAYRKDDYYVLNGSKFWITNGLIADVIVVYAKTSANKITAFIVEKNFEGFSTGKKIIKMGMRGSPTCELIFQDCKVPASNILGGLDKGVYVMMRGLNYERLVLAAGPVGIMQRACALAFSYAHDRQAFGQKIGKFQLLQGKMADMFTETMFCRSGLYAAARSIDNLDPKVESESVLNAKCAAVILKCAESATKIACDAIQILGGNGYTEDYETSRLLRDAKLYEIGAGTSEIRRWLIGRELNKTYLN